MGDFAASTTLVALAFGTNLFFYSSFAGGMSHPFLFFLCALLIERTDRWYAAPSLPSALLIGLCLGLATLARPTSAMLALIPLCWNVRAGGSGLLRMYGRHLVRAVLITCCCLVPQLLYWKVTTGSFLFWSYGTETFDFSRPHITEGLFSFRKGWFVYTPLALVALASVVLLRRDAWFRSYLSMLLCFFLPFLFITFSWDPWWYGGSFGSRPMIDTLPLLALPLAILAREALTWKALPRIGVIALLAACITLNLFQQWQYQRGIIHHEAMTMERWWQVFLEPTSVGLPPFP